MVLVPPIKSQGIKTKLVEWIRHVESQTDYDRWVEPFMGTGVVGFNIVNRPGTLLCDNNPHIINFYQAVKNGQITAGDTREFLTSEGAVLSETDGAHYYAVRDRFNEKRAPLDFLFLSRACFNGLMRFNSVGGYNVPFCRKPDRFSKALVTKICNQIDAISAVISSRGYEFKCQPFEETLAETGGRDLVYCDPPYIGRHATYYSTWSETEEKALRKSLTESECKYILSTWYSDRRQNNDSVRRVWSGCHTMTRSHYYHVSGRESGRQGITEALLTNFPAIDYHQFVETSDNVTRNPDICFGEPIFSVSSCRVQDLVQRIMTGEPVEEVADDFGTPLEHVLEVWDECRLKLP